MIIAIITSSPTQFSSFPTVAPSSKARSHTSINTTVSAALIIWYPIILVCCCLLCVIVGAVCCYRKSKSNMKLNNKKKRYKERTAQGGVQSDIGLTWDDIFKPKTNDDRDENGLDFMFYNPNIKNSTNTSPNITSSKNAYPNIKSSPNAGRRHLSVAKQKLQVVRSPQLVRTGTDTKRSSRMNSLHSHTPASNNSTSTDTNIDYLQVAVPRVSSTLPSIVSSTQAHKTQNAKSSRHIIVTNKRSLNSKISNNDGSSDYGINDKNKFRQAYKGKMKGSWTLKDHGEAKLSEL